MKSLPVFVLICCLFFANTLRAISFSDFFGPRFSSQKNTPAAQAPQNALDSIHRWNQIAIDASGLDHTPGTPAFGYQLGPARASRAMAIVHIAIFDSVNAILGGYEGYTGIQPVKPPVSLDAAVAQAAHDTLITLFPAQAASFDAALTADLGKIANKNERASGVSLGQRVASAILALRGNDGAQIAEPHWGVDYFLSSGPGVWQMDPISMIPTAVGAHWAECAPFVMQSGSQFRAPPPPDMASAEYAAAYNEAKSLGGDGVHTPSARTPEQSFIGIFWAYDGTPSLCAPPRFYNQITVHVADQMHLNTIQFARLLALMNTAMADAGIAVWDSKFHYNFWRPIGGIPGADFDGNPATTSDPGFTPMGAPASNLTGPNFTPPFPSYPSGHGGFGGAIFQTMRRFFGTDNIPFTIVSDEFNGVTKDNSGNVRPFMPRSYNTFSQAEEENGQSRIYLGIHWSFDKTAAIAQGRAVANYVFDHSLRPVSKH